jgi:phage terminase large subunit-like protein
LAILDEAWSLDARAEQATRPAMATRRNAQSWLASTAGTERSVWWRQKVDGGRAAADAGLTEGSAFFEWAADPEADIGDPTTWWSCMPALGHTVEQATIAADLAAMHPAEFRRAYANQWPDEALEGWCVIPRELWLAARL